MRKEDYLKELNNVLSKYNLKAKIGEYIRTDRNVRYYQLKLWCYVQPDSPHDVYIGYIRFYRDTTFIAKVYKTEFEEHLDIEMELIGNLALEEVKEMAMETFSTCAI